eukprot:Polyplicarium_translucidae@DN4761_c0_g1_i1.p1
MNSVPQEGDLDFLEATCAFICVSHKIAAEYQQFWTRISMLALPAAAMDMVVGTAVDGLGMKRGCYLVERTAPASATRSVRSFLPVPTVTTAAVFNRLAARAWADSTAHPLQGAGPPPPAGHMQELLQWRRSVAGRSVPARLVAVALPRTVALPPTVAARSGRRPSESPAVRVTATCAATGTGAVPQSTAPRPQWARNGTLRATPITRAAHRPPWTCPTRGPASGGRRRTK